MIYNEALMRINGLMKVTKSYTLRPVYINVTKRYAMHVIHIGQSGI